MAALPIVKPVPVTTPEEVTAPEPIVPTVIFGEPANPVAVPVSVPVTFPVNCVDVITPVLGLYVNPVSVYIP